jgi:N-formylglutamate amidohydrolase
MQARSMALSLLWDAHSIRSEIPWLFDGLLARPEHRNGQRRGRTMQRITHGGG